MVVRQQASQINPTRIGLSAGSELVRLRLFDYLSLAKQELFYKAKKFKDEKGYRFLLGQELHLYLRKAKGSRALKISKLSCVQKLVIDQ